MEQIQQISQKIVFMKNNKVLMLKDTKNQWELPGGRIDFAEDAKESVRRELKEEMDINKDQFEIKELIGSFNIIRRFPDKHYHILVLVYGGDLNTETIKLSSEHVEYNWFSKNELVDLITVPEYRDFFIGFNEL